MHFFLLGHQPRQPPHRALAPAKRAARRRWRACSRTLPCIWSRSLCKARRPVAAESVESVRLGAMGLDRVGQDGTRGGQRRVSQRTHVRAWGQAHVFWGRWWRCSSRSACHVCTVRRASVAAVPSLARIVGECFLG
eukprot:gene13554-biopygen18565